MSPQLNESLFVLSVSITIRKEYVVIPRLTLFNFIRWRNWTGLIKNILPSSPAGSFALTASKQARKLSSLVGSSSNGTIWPRARAASSCCGLLSPAPPGSLSFCRSDSIAFRILTDGELPVGSSRPAKTCHRRETWRHTLCFESPSSPQFRVPLRYTSHIDITR